MFDIFHFKKLEIFVIVRFSDWVGFVTNIKNVWVRFGFLYSSVRLNVTWRLGNVRSQN